MPPGYFGPIIYKRYLYLTQNAKFAVVNGN